MLRRYRLTVVALCAAGAMTGAVGAAAQAQAPSEDAPIVLRQNGVEYVSGGIGEDQVAAMRQLSSHYSLRVMVAGRGGEYLSDVDVTISSAAGKPLLAARTDGPYLLVRLPAGRYRVTVQSGQAHDARSVTVPEHGTAHLDFHLATNES